jgi:hypothetical protein
MSDILESSKEKIKNHLSKFDDIEYFLNQAESEVQLYFEMQNKFKTIESFKTHLTVRIQFYISWFSLPSKERKQMKAEIRLIEEAYDKLLYFSEYNTLEALRKEKNEDNYDGSLWGLIKAYVRSMWITYKPFKS